MSHYNLLVIGGGSGGLAAAKRAAGYGAKVAIAESNKWGGTCVNVGCVPKKMMWWASTMREFVHDSNMYGVSADYKGFNWKYMKERRDFTINRLNGIYINGLKKLDITVYEAFAELNGKNEHNKPEAIIEGNKVSADHIILCPGGYPVTLDIPGKEHQITSDDFFWMDEQPEKCAVIGAGYIAVELAQVLKGLGSEVDLFCRGDNTLRTFDTMVQEKLDKFIRDQGVNMRPGSVPTGIEKKPDGLYLSLENGKTFGPFDKILSAVGRKPMIEKLNLQKAGVKLDKKGHIDVDEWQNTSADGILALGDVTDAPQLTPVAIATGRRLADRLFGGIADSKADYEHVPTVVFSHPPIGTIGMTEQEAITAYGKENVEIYNSVSVNLYYSAFDMAPEDKPRIYMKLICNKADNERIVGMHSIGMGTDEYMQGFGIAFKMGCTKKDLDKVCAIHPSAAEEMVTMDPWGMTKDEMTHVKEKAKENNHLKDGNLRGSI